MAPRKTSAHLPAQAEAGRERLARGLDGLALFILLLVVAMRPLLSETYDSALNSIARAVGTTESLTPAATAWFDLAIWLAAVAAAGAGLLRRARWRWTGLEIGWLVLLVAAIISTWFASNKRLAINASCDWLSAIVLAMVLANVVRERREVLLVLAIVVASGLAAAAKCGTWLAWESKETLAEYQRTREAFWAQQGVPPDDARVELFERRLKAGEPSGFMAYSNAQGAGLSLSAFAGLALAATAGRSRGPKVLGLVLAAVLFVMILPTGGKGAMLASALGVAIWVALSRFEGLLRKQWQGLWLAGWLTILVGAAAVIVVGTGRGGLPGASLRFRWNYWQVTSAIIAENRWTGVGALNFDRAYMKHKPIEYPEEIRDPHNFVVSIISQWGLIGGIGLAMTVIGASAVGIRRWAEGGQDEQPRAASEGSPSRWLIALIAGFVLLRLWMLRSWWMTSVEGAAATFFDVGLYGLTWAIGLGLILWLLWPSLDAERCRLACFCGGIAFLLQNTIDFSLFVPATLIPFMAVGSLLLCQLGRREVGPVDRQRSTFPLIVAMCGAVLVLVLVVIPATRSAYLLADARQITASSPGDAGAARAAFDCYLEAVGADRFDPTPLVEAATYLARSRQSDDLAVALNCLARAELHDPLDRGIHRLRSQILHERYKIGHSPSDLLDSIAAAEKGLALYPASPDDHIALAELLSEASRALKVPASTPATTRDFRSEAIQHYRRALDLDAARPTDEIRRWSAPRRQAMEERWQGLVSAISTHPASATANTDG